MAHASSNTYQAAFFIVPSYIMNLEGLTLGYLKVYEIIFQFWNHNKKCFIGESELCRRSGLERRHIYNALAFFEKAGELKRTQKKGKRYIVRPSKEIETDCIDIKLECTPVHASTIIEHPCTPVHPPVHSSALSTCTPVHHNNKKINKEFKKTDKPVPVFSESCFVKNHIEMVIANRKIFVEEDVINQGIYYSFETNDDKSFDSVNKRINIFLKKVRIGQWLIPQGYKGITSQSIRKEEERAHQEKLVQHEEDRETYQAITKTVEQGKGLRDFSALVKKLKREVVAKSCVA